MRQSGTIILYSLGRAVAVTTVSPATRTVLYKKGGGTLAGASSCTVSTRVDNYTYTLQYEYRYTLLV